MEDKKISNKEVGSSPVKKKQNGSICSIFMHADGVDIWLMAVGFIGAVTDGTVAPLLIYLTGRLFNNIGGASASAADILTSNVHQVAISVILTACVGWVGSLLEGYCWTRTSERQATRIRTRYLKAVLRQDVGYFDVNVTSTAEIVTSVSNDSLIIQEVISEKVPNLIARGVSFMGTYIAAFLILWRLALVIFPFALLLVIPTLIYGKTLLNLARKIRVEYNKANSIAEQAISCLAKGLAIESNGITFAIWAFITYYGSRMVMYNGAKGGTVFMVGSCIAVRGQSLGASLSNLKPLFEAYSAAERINEVIKRVPKIDLENMEGEILDSVLGEVEFKQVEFAYPSRSGSLILKNFCLKIPARKTVALVGTSGSGKSTVISLLQRFYDPLGGDILLDEESSFDMVGGFNIGGHQL
ncbi:hypothetical protein DITRI_Ditri16bG0123100 [Diplodiscus trichospermus]